MLRASHQGTRTRRPRSRKEGIAKVAPWPACTGSIARSALPSWSARTTSPPRCATRSPKIASVTRTCSRARAAPARPRLHGCSRALNCLNLGADGEPCGECENCVAIAEGAFYDLVELDAASNRGIDAIRELIQRVHLGMGATTKRRIYVIDEVHMLTTERRTRS